MSFINSLYQRVHIRHSLLLTNITSSLATSTQALILCFQSVADNERNLHFWENYLNNLKALDFNVYADKLKVPTLVPIGSRVFFRGELKHTNEVTVALGADYFVKCSLAQAEDLKQHRIKGKLLN